jgi:hypothetical protein
VGDAVAAGLLADRTRPGGNVTGISSLRSELAAKRLQVLHSLAPAVRRVFVVHERSDPVAASIVRNAVGAGPALGLDVVVRDVDDDADLAAILAQIGPGDALFAADDSRLRIPVAVLERSLASRSRRQFEDRGTPRTRRSATDPAPRRRIPPVMPERVRSPLLRSEPFAPTSARSSRCCSTCFPMPSNSRRTVDASACASRRRTAWSRLP